MANVTSRTSGILSWRNFILKVLSFLELVGKCLWVSEESVHELMRDWSDWVKRGKWQESGCIWLLKWISLQVKWMVDKSTSWSRTRVHFVRAKNREGKQLLGGTYLELRRGKWFLAKFGLVLLAKRFTLHSKCTTWTLVCKCIILLFSSTGRHFSKWGYLYSPLESIAATVCSPQFDQLTCHSLYYVSIQLCNFFLRQQWIKRTDAYLVVNCSSVTRIDDLSMQTTASPWFTHRRWWQVFQNDYSSLDHCFCLDSCLSRWHWVNLTSTLMPASIVLVDIYLCLTFNCTQVVYLSPRPSRSCQSRSLRPQHHNPFCYSSEVVDSLFPEFCGTLLQFVTYTFLFPLWECIWATTLTFTWGPFVVPLRPGQGGRDMDKEENCVCPYSLVNCLIVKECTFKTGHLYCYKCTGISIINRGEIQLIQCALCTTHLVAHSLW